MKDKEEKYWREIEEIEKDYFEILNKFSFIFPKPLNLQSEKKTFFKALVDDEIYNPQLRYVKKKQNIEVLEELNNFTFKSGNKFGFKKLYLEVIKNKILQVNYHNHWGHPLGSVYAIKYWGLPNYFLFKKAMKFCKEFEREKVRFKRITPKVVGDDLKKEVKRLTGKNITIRYAQINAKVNIEAYANLIQINPDETFTSLDLKRLKVHEIGTHYMRYYNGHLLGRRILETGTKNYLETEEGLAAYMEELKGVSSKAQMFIYAGRVIASYYAPKKSFYEIFMILKKLEFRDDAAFAITFRVKRNLCDTSQKGGFTKDYVYFSGYLKVKKFAEKNDVKDLFIGKVKIDDLKILKKYIKQNKDKIVTILD